MITRIRSLRTATPMSASHVSCLGRHMRYSTQTKPPNPTVRIHGPVPQHGRLTPGKSSFYKTFGRPVGKVLLLAVFTYQVVYWTWAKLEAEETREQTDATIADLETTVHEYAKSKKG